MHTRTPLTPVVLATGVLALTGCGLFSGGEATSESTVTAIEGVGAAASVVDIIDPDTVKVDRNGEIIYVDLLGVAAPQAKHDNEDMRCMAPEAKEHLAKLLPIGSPVTLTHESSVGEGETDDKTPPTIQAAITLPDRRMANIEVARAGFAVAVNQGNSDLHEKISAAQEEAAQQQAGIYSRTNDCTLPARLDSALTNINKAQGIDLKDPLEAADTLTRRLDEYETANDLPLLSAIAQTQSVKTQRDALTRASDSKRIVYNLAEEAERERVAREQTEQNSHSGEPAPPEVRQPEVPQQPEIQQPNTQELAPQPQPETPAPPQIEEPQGEPAPVTSDAGQPVDAPQPETPDTSSESST